MLPPATVAAVTGLELIVAEHARSARAVLARLMELARRRDVPPARLAMGWVLSRPEVSSMLCGVLDDSHLDEAVLALDLVLSPDEIAFLESAYQPQAVKDTGLGAVLGSAASSSPK